MSAGRCRNHDYPVEGAVDNDGDGDDDDNDWPLMACSHFAPADGAQWGEAAIDYYTDEVGTTR
jgi:hypothetical protein